MRLYYDIYILKEEYILIISQNSSIILKIILNLRNLIQIWVNLCVLNLNFVKPK